MALKPYEQKELMQLVLQRAEVNEREITLEIYALNEASLPEKEGPDGEVVRARPDWLPGWGDNPNFFHLQNRSASLEKPAKGANGVRFYDDAVGF